MIVVNQSIGELTNDILIDFVKNNEQIYVFTSKNLDNLVPSKKIRYFYGCSYNKRNYITRLFSWILFTIQTFIFLKKNQKKHQEIFLISNPPFLFFLVLFFRNNKFYLLVYDLYPDILKIKIRYDLLGIIRFWSITNKYIFRKVDLIFTIGENMKSSLIKYCDIDKIIVIHNWSKLKHYDGGCNESLDKKYFYLNNNFIFVYTGNMGVTHNFEVIKSLMLEFRSYDNIYFIFVSSGKKFIEMKRFVSNNSIVNSVFLDKLPQDEYDYILSKSSLGIITLDKSMGLNSVPSKTFSYISHGLPIINFSTSDSEISTLVNKYSIGINFDIDTYDNSLLLITNLITNKKKLEELKLNAYNTAEIHFSVHNSKSYLQFIKNCRLNRSL